MTVISAETPFYATGRDAFLLDGLRAILLHQRAEHQRLLAKVHKPRPALSSALMDLCHNWPDVVSGANQFHTATMIADQIDHTLLIMLELAEAHDQALRTQLGSLGRALRTV